MFMAKKLIALSEYHAPSRGLHYKAGELFDADDALYLFLMADAPGCFSEGKEVVAPAASKLAPHAAEMTAPPVDKMVHAPKAKK